MCHLALRRSSRTATIPIKLSAERTAVDSGTGTSSVPPLINPKTAIEPNLAESRGHGSLPGTLRSPAFARLTVHKLALETACSIGKIAVAPSGKCGNIPFAPEQIKKVEARGAIGKKPKSAKC